MASHVSYGRHVVNAERVRRAKEAAKGPEGAEIRERKRGAAGDAAEEKTE